MNGAALRQIFLSSVVQRKGMGSFWPACFIFAAAALLATLLFFGESRQNPWPSAFLAFVGVSCVNLIPWWSVFVSNLARQCSPTNLQLTPGLRKTVLAAFLGHWLAISIIPAVLFSLVAGHFILFWLGIGIFLLSFTPTFASGRLLFSASFCVLAFSVTLVKGFLQTSGLFQGSAGPVLVAATALLACAVLTAVVTFSLHGERSMMRYSLLLKSEQWKKTGVLPAPDRGWQSLITMQWPYEWRLNRMLGGFPDIRANKDEFFLLGFGHGMHWISLFSIAIASAGMLLIVHLICQVFAPLHGAGMGLTFGLSMGAIIQLSAYTVIRFPSTLLATRKEQALLKLLPHVAQDIEMNRLLARTALSLLFFGWLLSLLFGFASLYWLEHAYGVSSKEAGRILIPVVASIFCSGTTLLRPYAALTALKMKAVNILQFSPLVFILFTGEWVSLRMLWTGLAAFVLVTLFVLRLQWKKTVHAPSALPVGRLAA